MKLENEFTIDAPASQVWTTMLDFERVAGCVPGSQVIGPAEGGGLEANIRVKVGPMTMSYRGVVAIVEQDEDLRRAVMQAKARESRGQGTANARMVMEVHEGTPVSVSIATDLDVSGRVAQMGRGVMQDVAGRIVDDFAKNLQGVVAADRPDAGAAPPAPAPAPAGDAGRDAAISGRKLAIGVIQGRLRALRDWLRALLSRRRS
jgi:carbon monoxide dehydrogenase subunit G